MSGGFAGEPGAARGELQFLPLLLTNCSFPAGFQQSQPASSEGLGFASVTLTVSVLLEAMPGCVIWSFITAAEPGCLFQ